MNELALVLRQFFQDHNALIQVLLALKCIDMAADITWTVKSIAKD